MAFCEPNSNPSTLFIIFGFALLLFCLFNTTIGSFGIYKVIKSHKKKECSDNILYILVTLLFIISSICFFFLVVSTTFCWLNHIGHLILKAISAFTYLQGISLLYSLYCFRLKKMFKSTEFSLPTWQGMMLFLGYFVQCILIIAQITVLSIETQKYSSSTIKIQRLFTPTIRIIICV
eukprot:1059210_1